MCLQQTYSCENCAAVIAELHVLIERRWSSVSLFQSLTSVRQLVCSPRATLSSSPSASSNITWHTSSLTHSSKQCTLPVTATPLECAVHASRLHAVVGSVRAAYLTSKQDCVGTLAIWHLPYGQTSYSTYTRTIRPRTARGLGSCLQTNGKSQVLVRPITASIFDSITGATCQRWHVAGEADNARGWEWIASWNSWCTRGL